MIKIDLDHDGNYYVVEENGDIYFYRRDGTRGTSSMFQTIEQVSRERRFRFWSEQFMRLYEHQLRKHPVNLF